jgi:hypothetical protein
LPTAFSENRFKKLFNEYGSFFTGYKDYMEYKKLHGFSKGGNKLPGYFSQAGNASGSQKHYRWMR